MAKKKKNNSQHNKRKKNMGKINVKIFKPFGSSISMQDLPLELMKDF